MIEIAAAAFITAAVAFGAILLDRRNRDTAFDRQIDQYRMMVNDQQHTILSLHTRLLAPLESANADIAQSFERVAAEADLIRRGTTIEKSGGGAVTATANTPINMDYRFPRTEDDIALDERVIP